jgi:hypothetical protein
MKLCSLYLDNPTQYLVLKKKGISELNISNPQSSPEPGNSRWLPYTGDIAFASLTGIVSDFLSPSESNLFQRLQTFLDTS